MITLFKTDLTLLMGYILSALLGSLMLASVSPDRIRQHLLMLVIGLSLLIYCANQEDSVYKTFAPFGYVFSILLLVASLIFANLTRGTLSWIEIGSFRFQPSEIAKPFLILAFAYLLERFPPLNFKNILTNLVAYLLPVSLILSQPDFGTGMVISIIWLTQVFIAGLPLKYLLSGLLLAFVTLPFSLTKLHSYQLSRLTSFLDPFSDPLGSGYNVIQSMIAVGSGGIFGKGLGHGTQSHLRFLPERHTDFAFASLTEELGLIGALLVIVASGILIFKILSAATLAVTKHNRLILTGSVAYFAFQSLINIGMNLGIAPITGITLPLISYGGSSIIATSIILGISSSTITSAKKTRLLEIR